MQSCSSMRSEQTETRAKLYWVASADRRGWNHLKQGGRFARALAACGWWSGDLSMPGMDGFEFLAASAKKSSAGGAFR